MGDELFAISDTSSLWMIAAANEADLSKLHPGQPVRISRFAPIRAANLPARILKLGEQLDPDTHTLQVRILVPNPQGLLKPEMYATAIVRRVRTAFGSVRAGRSDSGGERGVGRLRSSQPRIISKPARLRRASTPTGGTEILEGLTARRGRGCEGQLPAQVPTTEKHDSGELDVETRQC